MIKTYLKLAFRSLVKNRVFSFINVFGLAIGFTCCLLISLYLYHEFSYDRHQEQGDRLYQVGTASIDEGKELRYGMTTAPMAPALKQDFSEIQSFTRMIDAFQDDKTLLQYRQGKEVRSFYETKGYFVDSTFFQLFTYDFIEGDEQTALKEPNSVVLSEEVARNIFGKEPAINKILHINSNTNGAFDFRVTGVYRPASTPSHIEARFIMTLKGGSIAQWVNGMTEMVNNGMFFTYLLLKPGADPKKLEAKFDGFIKRHMAADLAALGMKRWHFLTRVRDIHLAGGEYNVSPGGSRKYLYILLSIAIVTLLIACVNFMNLSTARSAKRALEIGVRKVLGAERTSLVRQFLFEAILLSLVALLVAFGITLLLLPLFEQVSGKEFLFGVKEYGGLLAVFFLVAVTTGLLAGLYPALYLSAFRPVKVLKGRFSNSLAAISFRKVLVVFQFVLSVVLMIASITISNQMRYMRSKDLGFQKESQVLIPLRTSNAQAAYTSLKNELLSTPSIASAGGSFSYPGIRSINWLMYKQGKAPDDTRSVYMNIVDQTYLQTLGIQLVAGRLFSQNFPGDTANRIILNESAVTDFGFASPEDAVGRNIAATRSNGEVLFPIVGVVKDFHFTGLQTRINGFGFLLNSDPSFSYLMARVKGNSMEQALNSIRKAWNRLVPDEPFEYSFLDQEFEKNYIAEERVSAIIRYFTIIAIFISCLGLFGLTTFSVEQRTKEIGIRKVLGASTPGIVALLSKDFLKLVVLSFLIASPIAWYSIHQWLQDFAYKAPFTIWILLMGWGLAFLIAFFTISIQSIKVALSNPVKNLRSE